MNNFISHPPHPRRAVPANLPPGAFFIISLWFVFRSCRVFPLLVFLSFFSIGSAQEDKLNQGTFSDRIASLRIKSKAHSRYVSELLATSYQIEEKIGLTGSIDSQEFPSSDEIPPMNSNDQGAVTATPVNPSVVEEPDRPSVFLDDFTVDSIDESTASSGSTAETKDQLSYDDIYVPSVVTRSSGYYFGPLAGLSHNRDSSVRGSSPDNGYDADSGYFLGFRLGNDFGYTRLEADYSFLNYDISNSSSNGEVSVHGLTGRFLVEKELGDRFDLRAGLGLGISMIEKNFHGRDYEGTGFSYDFLLGFSVRIKDNWSLAMDYRYYLTAAHKNYDRLQSHLLELSANFDL